MKKTFLYICTLLFIGMYSCKKSDYLLYDSNEPNKISFKKDTIRFNFGMLLDQDVDLKVNTFLIGMVNKSTDNIIGLAVNKALTTAEAGKHFSLPASIALAKDSSTKAIPLNFFKENLEFDKDYFLTLDLQTNDHFQATDTTRCVVVFGNKSIPAPIWWRSDRLGDYNQDKFVLFVAHFTETKDVSAVLYNKLRDRWGEHLTTGTAINLLTVAEYREYIKRYILIPIYQHYLDTNDDRYKIPNPN